LSAFLSFRGQRQRFWKLYAERALFISEHKNQIKKYGRK
jgi:hypothetical protein